MPTLGDALRQVGRRTAAVMWPGTVGAPIDYNIPEIWPIKDGDDRITAARPYCTPGLLEEVEKNATGNLTRENMNESYLSFDENAGRIAAYIYEKYRPNLLAVHFACVDGEQHAQGIDGDSVKLAVETADRAIGDLLESVDRSGLADSTDVIVVGDHGFTDFHRVIFPQYLVGGSRILASWLKLGYEIPTSGWVCLSLPGKFSRHHSHSLGP